MALYFFKKCTLTGNNNGDFYCIGCLHSFKTDNTLKNTKDYVTTIIIAI